VKEGEGRKGRRTVPQGEGGERLANSDEFAVPKESEHVGVHWWQS